MRRYFIVGLFFLVLSGGFLAQPSPARAASQISSITFVNVQVFATNHCANGDQIVNFGIVVKGTAGGAGTFALSMTLGGSGTPITYSNTVPDSRLGVSLNGFNGSAGIATVFNGTNWTALNGTATVTVTAGGSRATITVNCVTQTVIVQNFNLAGGGPGPGIPSGFVLRTIICDVAVFQTAGGIPVPSGEHIINGQTWFVNPKPVKDPKGKLWTEIFDAGYINGFIPTSCVGDKPAGYLGS